MSGYDDKSSKERIFPVEETIYKPRTESRVELPADEQEVYEEVQPFDQLWLWALMGIELVILVIALFQAGQALWTIGMGLIVMTLTMALLSSLKLYTRIDSLGVHFRMTPFHFKEQVISWEEVDQIYVRKYSPILEYGGWGIRFGLNGKAYNVRGNYGIQIVKKNGKRILIGTQRAEEAASHLRNHPLLV